LLSALPLLLVPIDYVACYNNATRYNRARRSNCTEGHERCYTSFVDAASKHTDLVHFENHVSRLNLAFRVIDLNRMWYVHAPLKECCSKKQQPSHMHSPRPSQRMSALKLGTRVQLEM
jgi:hypothetical protein